MNEETRKMVNEETPPLHELHKLVLVVMVGSFFIDLVDDRRIAYNISMEDWLWHRTELIQQIWYERTMRKK